MSSPDVSNGTSRIVAFTDTHLMASAEVLFSNVHDVDTFLCNDSLFTLDLNFSLKPLFLSVMMYIYIICPLS